MTAAMVEHDQAPLGGEWEYLLQTWRELDVPEGWRAEIDEGQIALVPPPHGHHNAIAAQVQRHLYRSLPEDLEIFQTLGVHIPDVERLYIPDLVVMPEILVLERDPENNDPYEAAEAELVVEITSKGNARTDRTRKLWAYAHAPVPLYLLIDRFDARGPMVTLYSDPQNGTYKHADVTPFGRPLTLPAPFHATLPTEKFPR
ncbi:Uma2 family endonuclease [Streptomyces physcomitrii]|uniref:Uma2 family endonuclease n=1 Tax=Streptomyces physcomitrii TaxID=2724184 RepID=UPI0033F67F2B